MMKARGFTLVELSIVLVIIALLFVGILQGQSLIGQARSNDVVAIIDDLRNATTQFKQRYKYLPGDWPYTANEIPNVVAATSVGTNGDGYVDGSVDATGAAEAGSEVAELPWQLFNAGFIAKIDQGTPTRRITTSFGPVHVVSRATANSLVAGFSAENPSARNAVVFFNLPCNLVAEVDGKIDNNAVTTGHALGAACNGGSMQWYAVAL